jgi:hypothetical protein
MMSNKDQAEKLRALAQKEGLNKPEDILTYSSLVGADSADKAKKKACFFA